MSIGSRAGSRYMLYFLFPAKSIRGEPHGEQVISEPHQPWERAIHMLTGRAQAGPAAGHMPCKLQLLPSFL